MPLTALLPSSVAVALPVRSVFAEPLPRPCGRLMPVTAVPPWLVRACPVLTAVSSVRLPGGWNSAQTRAAIPTAAWTEAPASCPVSGLSSSQIHGVETTPAAASTMTVIFHPCDMLALPCPGARRRKAGGSLPRLVGNAIPQHHGSECTVRPAHPSSPTGRAVGAARVPGLRKFTTISWPGQHGRVEHMIGEDAPGPVRWEIQMQPRMDLQSPRPHHYGGRPHRARPGPSPPTSPAGPPPTAKRSASSSAPTPAATPPLAADQLPDHGRNTDPALREALPGYLREALTASDGPLPVSGRA